MALAATLRRGCDHIDAECEDAECEDAGGETR